MTTPCYWPHSLALWLATAQHWIRSGLKKPGWEHLDPNLSQDRTCSPFARLAFWVGFPPPLLFKNHFKVTSSWSLKARFVRREWQLLITLTRYLEEKDKLKGTQALHLATQRLKFHFLILREGKGLLLFPPFYILQFNPEKLKILSCFVLFPLWSVCVFPFLTVYLFNTFSALEAWQCGKRNNESNTETEQEISWKLFIPVFYNILKGKKDKTGLKYHLQRPLIWNSEILRFLVSVKIWERKDKKKSQIP